MAARDELEKLRRMRELEARIPKAGATALAPPPGEAARENPIMRFGQGIADKAESNTRKLVNLEHTLLRKGAGLLGVEMDPLSEGNAFSDQTIARRQAETAPNSETGLGGAGNVAADLAITAPLGYIGKGMEGVAALRGTPKILSRALSARPVQAVTEGAVAGGALADPGDRKEGAATGGSIGLLLERGGRALGRTMEGIVKRSKDAQALDNLADLHGTKVDLPLSVAASDEGVASPLVKFVYDKVLPNLPWAEGALAKQGQKAGAQFRELAMKEAAPGGMGSTQKGYSGGLPLTTNKQAGAGTDIRASMDDIQKAFEREYSDTIKSYAFNKPNTADLATALQQKFPNIDQASMQGVLREFDNLANRYSKNGVLDGDNLLRMKNRLAHAGREAGEDRVGQSFYVAQEFLDDLVRSELRAGGNKQNLIDLQRYEDLAEPYKNFLRVQKAAGRTKDSSGQFTPSELKAAVKSLSNDATLARGQAPMQELAEIGQRTVGQPIHQPSYLERGLTLASLGGMGIFSGPIGVATLLAGGRTAANPGVQEALMGNTATQKAIINALRNNPEKARISGAALRNTVAGEVAQDE